MAASDFTGGRYGIQCDVFRSWTIVTCDGWNGVARIAVLRATTFTTNYSRSIPPRALAETSAREETCLNGMNVGCPARRKKHYDHALHRVPMTVAPQDTRGPWRSAPWIGVHSDWP